MSKQELKVLKQVFRDMPQSEKLGLKFKEFVALMSMNPLNISGKHS